MTVPKTASKTALLLQCPRPFSEDTETEPDEPGEAALYGTRWHKAVAHHYGSETHEHPGFPEDRTEREAFIAHVEQGTMALDEWMRPTGNPWGLSFQVTEVETSRALDLTKSSDGTIKAILHEQGNAHEYTTEKGEVLPSHFLAGTADVVLEAKTGAGIFRVGLDHKTGEDRTNSYVSPSDVPQMQALAEMWEADAVAILHAPKGAPVQIYAEQIPRGVSRFRHELWRAYRLVDSGFMRPGPECKFCPARASCPAKQGELLASTSQILGAALVKREEPMTPGRFHQLRSQWAALEKQALAQLREDVRSGEIIERPDGKVLEIQTVQVERLSKKSILEALGAEEGKQLLEELRAAGALKEVEEERLVAK